MQTGCFFSVCVPNYFPTSKFYFMILGRRKVSLCENYCDINEINQSINGHNYFTTIVFTVPRIYRFQYMV